MAILNGSRGLSHDPGMTRRYSVFVSPACLADFLKAFSFCLARYSSFSVGVILLKMASFFLFLAARASSDDVAFLAVRLSTLTALSASYSAMRSSNVGIGGRSSMGVPYGAMICLTTCRLCWEVRHPGTMETTSPARNEELGSCTR